MDGRDAIVKDQGDLDAKTSRGVNARASLVNLAAAFREAGGVQPVEALQALSEAQGILVKANIRYSKQAGLGLPELSAHAVTDADEARGILDHDTETASRISRSQDPTLHAAELNAAALRYATALGRLSMRQDGALLRLSETTARRLGLTHTAPSAPATEPSPGPSAERPDRPANAITADYFDDDLGKAVEAKYHELNGTNANFDLTAGLIDAARQAIRAEPNNTALMEAIGTDVQRGEYQVDRALLTTIRHVVNRTSPSITLEKASSTEAVADLDQAWQKLQLTGRGYHMRADEVKSLLMTSLKLLRQIALHSLNHSVVVSSPIKELLDKVKGA